MKTGPKDFFLYLGTIITLYAGTFALLSLLFGLVNAAFPDRLDYSFYPESLRASTAALIIIFPVFALLTWFLNRDITRQPQKRELWVRRWSVYLTLFLSAVAIIVDLIFLINNFLSGELTTRFVLKILSVLVVAGLIFSYYIFYLRGRQIYKLYLAISVVLVLATLIWSFATMGSPFTQRQLRFDQQRMNDIQYDLNQRITEFWRAKGRLPENLDELADPISNYKPPVDPETEASYGYRIIGPREFELCATFALPSAPRDIRSHQAGRDCFAFPIDPQRYPPYEKVLSPR